MGWMAHAVLGAGYLGAGAGMVATIIAMIVFDVVAVLPWAPR